MGEPKPDRLSVDVDYAKLRSLRILAAARGVTIKSLFNEILELYLVDKSLPRVPRTRSEVEA